MNRCSLPPWRVADRLGEALRQRRRHRARERVGAALAPLPSLRRVERLLRRLDAAERRGFDGARQRLERGAARAMRDAQALLPNALKALGQEACPAAPSHVSSHAGWPGARALLEELEQIADDHDGYATASGHTPCRDPRELIVTTESIELDDVPLGRFEIRLDLEHLSEGRDSPFRVAALDPHPPEGRPEVVHPHVDRGRLCEGDASQPIRRALDDGRVADFFALVRSVLRTYNPESPYVALADWDAVECFDCGDRCASDDAAVCEVCDRQMCRDCWVWCESEQAVVCLGCSVPVAPDGRRYHPDAVERCVACGQAMLAEELDADDRCPDCPSETSATSPPSEPVPESDLENLHATHVPPQTYAEPAIPA